MSAVQAGNIQRQLNFTRANEKEADRIGIQTLARSDIDPYGMPSFFERLHQSTRLYGNNVPEFLSTHPVTTNRIAESLQRAESYGRGKELDSLEFRLTRVRLKVLEADSPMCDPAMLDLLKEHSPALRNNLVILFSSQDPARLSSREGKEKLRAEVLAETKMVMKEAAGNDDIDAVYFTSFVMQ